MTDTPNPAPIAPDVHAVVERLNIRTVEYLPENWKAGLKCPECDGSAERQKCMWDRGGGCPRHNARYYEPSPYKIKPDKDCAEAADLITRLARELAAARQEIVDTLPMLDADAFTIGVLQNQVVRLLQAGRMFVAGYDGQSDMIIKAYYAMKSELEDKP